MHVVLCVHAPHMYECPQRAEDGIRCPGSEISSGCEPPYVNAGS